MSRYELHPEVEADLDAIWEYIADDNVDAADRVINQIESTLATLELFPYQGHRRPDLTALPLRFTNSGNYLIAYLPDKTPRLVIAVMHGQRSPRILATILKGRE